MTIKVLGFHGVTQHFRQCYEIVLQEGENCLTPWATRRVPFSLMYWWS